MEYDEFPAMNSTVLSAAQGSPEQLAPGFAAVRQFIRDCERRFSRFQADSELSLLNRSTGHWFPSSPELFELIEEALELHQLTRGLFDPSILEALIQSGYDRSMDEIRQAGPMSPGSTRSWQRPPFKDVRLDNSRQAIFLPHGVKIDLGGIAKGWIAGQAVKILNQFSPACAVSAGGDMALAGMPDDQTGWRISLEDPRDPERVLAVLIVDQGAVATSTVTKRHWYVGDQPRHHIIDPRTGQPCIPAWLSTTVITEKATYAEAFAKALLIAGPQEALEISAGVPGGLRWIGISPDGSLWGSMESKELIDVS